VKRSFDKISIALIDFVSNQIFSFTLSSDKKFFIAQKISVGKWLRRWEGEAVSSVG